MKRTPVLALAAAALLFIVASPVASAATLAVDSALSNLDFGIILGAIDDDPESPTFGEFIPLTAALPQGPLSGLLPVGDGTAVSGYSTGLSAQPNGTINADTGGFSLTGGSNVGLNDSGLWQPGANIGTDGKGNPIFDSPPTSAQLGIYLDASAFADLQLTGRLAGLALDIETSGPLVLGPGGAFADPNAILTILGATLSAKATGSSAVVFGLDTIESTISSTAATVPIAGTYFDNTLTLPISTFIDIDLTETLGVPLVLRITVDGQIVANAVPEPTTLAMLGMGALGLGLVAVRRRRK